jgi:hypothetical protein
MINIYEEWKKKNNIPSLQIGYHINWKSYVELTMQILSATCFIRQSFVFLDIKKY